ncbi:hypothetical protein CYMTET_45189 [Cymbomonas tetramitiformis]|uniref:Kinesin motor domain-containing protein n=1 Tax=Cymbomonas tetramitiformis TaxID=36881 RepID=A0AAE0C0S4_9CHLO|nr:hypothetical protein CYMTET_45189 [Cymbomonas tetramitiformis]
MAETSPHQEQHEAMAPLRGTCRGQMGNVQGGLLLPSRYICDARRSGRGAGGRGLWQANEARSINLSLTVLGKCINARANPNSSHIPFRDSKLTRILQDCLSENSRTSLICCAYPGGEHGDETLVRDPWPPAEIQDNPVAVQHAAIRRRAMEVKLAASQNIGQDYRPRPMLSLASGSMPRLGCKLRPARVAEAPVLRAGEPSSSACSGSLLLQPFDLPSQVALITTASSSLPPQPAITRLNRPSAGRRVDEARACVEQELEAISDADSVAPSSPLSKHLHLELELKLERQRSHQLEEELSKTREELLQEAALRRRELAQQEDACQQRMRELEAVARTRLEEVEHTVRCAISGGGDGPATPVAGPTVQDAEGKMDGVAQAEQRMALMASRIDDMITSPAHGFAQNRLITQKAAAAAKIQMQWLRHRGRRRELQAQERDSMAQQRGKALEDLVAETETTTKQYLASTGRALIAQSILSIDRATDASLRMFLVPRKKLNR